MANVSVVLIEDDPIPEKSVHLVLPAKYIVCDAAHIGIEKLEIAENEDYDLIILDLLLPDVDGCKVLSR